MPELPEVETLCRQLRIVLPGQRIRRVEIIDSRLGKAEGLTGRSIKSIIRQGKFLFIGMSGGITAELHLRMTGRLLWDEREGRKTGLKNGADNEKPPTRQEGPAISPSGMAHIRLAISFSSGTLYLIDPRRFATFALNPPPRSLALLEDPLAVISAGRLREIAGTRQLPVKSFLMDQRFIAGIGNIYACEILFAARIDPRRPVCGLSPAEWRKVAGVTPPILERAVDCRGTTVSDWRDLFGNNGSNQENLAVYSRQGKTCVRCGGVIERIRQNGRGAWLCPSCQT